jgi:ADP-heptose:LPS heptosyltransferase
LQPIGYRNPVAVAVDLHGNGPASRVLLQRLRPDRLIGFGAPASGLVGPRWQAEEHEITRWQRLIAEGFGLPQALVTGEPAALAVPADRVPERLTVLHPGAASTARRWPAERFAAVADRLRIRGHRVVITGSLAERRLVTELAGATGAGALTGLGLRELFGVIAAARLVVCGDTGVAHVASLYRTPSVVLFGPVAPGRWGPPVGGPHRVLWHGDGTGNPHGSEPDPALLRITVAEVLAAIERLDRDTLIDSA